MPPAAKSRGAAAGWWSAVAGYSGLIFVVSIVPAPQGPPGLHLDKLGHLCEYLILAWLLQRALTTGAGRSTKAPWTAWTAATAYGLVIEAIQTLVPWRSGDWLDGAVNALGALLGVLAARWGTRSSQPT